MEALSKNLEAHPRPSPAIGREDRCAAARPILVFFAQNLESLSKTESKVLAMQWHKRMFVGVMLASMGLPVMVGCEQRQQVRPEVIEPETSEGRMELEDTEEETGINVGVRNEEE